MINVCTQCGEYHADKLIDASGPHAICPSCGHKNFFHRLPLFCLTGPSGSGKTSVCTQMMHIQKDVIVLESDILWREEFDSPETGWYEYRNLWLRICKNISQSGKPVLLCGSVSPGQFEPCVESRYFSSIHYLALVCNDETLTARLQNRPNWRDTQSEEFVLKQIKWMKWFKNTKHEQDIELVDTSNSGVEETAKSVRDWIRSKLEIIYPKSGK